MKKIYAALLLAIPFGLSAQIGLVDNGDFENWTNTILDQVVDDYETSNQEFPGTVTTSQSTDAAHLSYSLLMESKLYFGDTVFGYIINGDPETLTGGEQHNTNIDSLKIRVKYDVQPGDSATIALIQHGGPFPMLDIFKLTGSQSTWQTLSFPILGVPHDTVMFAASSSNAFANFAAPGSWLQIDHFELVNNGGANEDLTNNSFESWTDITYEDPNGWETYNDWGAYIGEVPTPKSTNSYSGTYAAELVSIDYDGDTANPLLTNGMIDQSLGPVGGVPYTSMPTNFEGAYLWNPTMTGDSAWISVGFKNGGSFIGGNVVALGGGDGTGATYQTFNIPTNLLSTPDSMIIAVYVDATPGVNLIVDALELTGNGVNIQEFSWDEFTVFPNPSNDRFTIIGASKNALIELYSIDGQLIKKTTGNKIDVSDVAHGAYTIIINGTTSRKVMVTK